MTCKLGWLAGQTISGEEMGYSRWLPLRHKTEYVAPLGLKTILNAELHIFRAAGPKKSLGENNQKPTGDHFSSFYK
jgi:hypothetical protein